MITGAEPVIVDCGPAVTREGWLERAFEIVDPGDVRWVYVSHDDIDHVGNLLSVLTRPPNRRPVSDMSHADLEALLASLPVPAAA